MELSNRNILITGGAGFIGSHLAERLSERNFVRVLDNFSTGRRENLQALQVRENAEIVEGDVTRPADAAGACRGMDVVFHLAVSCLRTSLGRPWDSHDTNAGGTLQMALAAHQAGVQRFVYVSSSEVYGSAERVPMAEDHPLEPMTLYGAAKLSGESYVKSCYRTYGLPVVIIRPFNTYGPREPWLGARAEVIPRFILRMLSGQPPVIFGQGYQTRDFTYVLDTIAGIVSAAECDSLIGSAVNVAAGQEVSLRQIAVLLADVLSISVTPRYADPRPCDVDRHVADISRAVECFGYRPAVNIRDGLRRTVEWFTSNVADAAKRCASAGLPNWSLGDQRTGAH